MMTPHCLVSIKVIYNYSIIAWANRIANPVLPLEDFEKPCYTIKTFQQREVSSTEKKGIKIAAQNRKAYHDYFVEDKYEAGIELFGTEVKSIRAGTLNLKDSYCTVKDGELFVHSLHISPYEKGNIFNKDPLRVKKLLLHKSEINKMLGKVKEKGISVVPLKVYLKGSLMKMEIGLAKGKKLYDQRDDIAKKDQRREAERDFKVRNIG